MTDFTGSNTPAEHRAFDGKTLRSARGYEIHQSA
ncbi:hypothetical protein Q604_UNBC11387G0001, partial [human gut metagenome]